MPMMGRRRGRPLVRAAATTAVVAGTAGAVHHHQSQKYAREAAEQQAMAEPAEPEVVYVEAPPAAAPAPAIDMAQLKELADLHAAGILTDEEFTAAKAKIIG
jgi:hypothetical protein